jgi:hypothetical protein
MSTFRKYVSKLFAKVAFSGGKYYPRELFPEETISPGNFYSRELFVEGELFHRELLPETCLIETRNLIY